jgi:hypothetical protein
MAVTPVIHDSATNLYRLWSPSDGPVGTARYQHSQPSPSAAWAVYHNLGTRALDITVFDTGGEQVFCGPDWASATSAMITLVFSVPLAGTAYVSPL